MALLSVLFSLLLPHSAYGQSWQYLYDEAGRLRAATAPSGARAEYDYDAAGNLLAIRTPAAGALTVSGFAPKSGAAGTVVTLVGAGFSPTPSLNTVTFNGVAATVTAATAGQLTVIAPAANTGPISVRVGTVTKISADVFTYSSVATNAPTITSVAPLCLNAGGTLTIRGTNFDITSGATRAELNVTALPTGAVTSTSVNATVLSAATTGPVRIVTARGTATSSQYVTVLPDGLSCATNYTATTILQPGGATATVSTTSSEKRAVIAIPLNGQDYVSLDFSSPTPDLSFTVIEPGSSVIATGRLSDSVRTILFPVAQRAGVYSVVLHNAGGAFSGTAQVRRAATLTPDGSAWAITSVPAGLTPRATFQANAGERFGLGVTNFTVPGGSAELIADILGPDGVKVGTLGAQPGNNYYSTSNLTVPTSGTYEVRFLYPTANTSASVWLSRDSGGTIIPNTPLTATITRAGQNRTYTFNAQAGDTFAVALANVAMTAPNTSQGLRVTALDPNGGEYGFTVAPSNAYLPVEIGPVQTPGLHTLRVEATDPGFGPLTNATGSGTVSLSRPASGTMIVDGTAPTVNAALVGQSLDVTFAGQAGEDIGIAIASLAYQPSDMYSVDVTLVKPGGQSVYLGEAYSAYQGWTFRVKTEVTGTYRLRVRPRVGMTSLSARFWASRDVRQRATLNKSTSVTLARPGQTVRTSFAAQAGQAVDLVLSNVAPIPASQGLRVAVYASNGAYIGGSDVSANALEQSIPLTSVPASGDCVVVISGSPNSSAGVTGSLTMKITPR
jgi:YD repeat-containing protein